MDEVLGQRPSDQEEKDEDDEEEDEGGHEAAERMERLFSAPEDNHYIISVS